MELAEKTCKASRHGVKSLRNNVSTPCWVETSGAGRIGAADGNGCRVIFADFSSRMPGKIFRKNSGTIIAIDSFAGSRIVSMALQLAPHVFVRPGELRTAKWADINFETKEWRYFVTKTKTQHIVPLSEQAVSILESIKPYTGNGVFVFSSPRTPKESLKN